MNNEVLKLLASANNIDFNFLFSSKSNEWEVQLEHNGREVKSFKASDLNDSIELACADILMLPTRVDDNAKALQSVFGVLIQNYGMDRTWDMLVNSSLDLDQKEKVLPVLLAFQTANPAVTLDPGLAVDQDGILINSALAPGQILDAARLGCVKTVGALLDLNLIIPDYPNPKKNDALIYGGIVYAECAKAGVVECCTLLKKRLPSLDFKELNEKAANGKLHKLDLKGVDYLIGEGVDIVKILEGRMINASPKQAKLIARILKHVGKPLDQNFSTRSDIVSEIELT